MIRSTLNLVLFTSAVIAASLLFAPSAGIAQTQPAATQPSAGGKFVDAKKRFSFDIPTSWYEKPAVHGQMACMVMSPLEGADDKFAENVNVIIIEIPAEELAKFTLDDDVAKAGLNGTIESMPGAELVGEIESVKVGGVEARRGTVRVVSPSGDLRIQQTLFVSNGDFYVVTFTYLATANESLLAAGNSVCETWKHSPE